MPFAHNPVSAGVNIPLILKLVFNTFHTSGFILGTWKAATLPEWQCSAISPLANPFHDQWKGRNPICHPAGYGSPCQLPLSA